MTRAADKAYTIIRELILSGAYSCGARLKEEELADRVGVSRTPIREALRRLDSEHLVKFVPNQGACVAAWSRSDIEEAFDIRAVLEATAVEKAAEFITGEEVDALVAAERQFEAAVFAKPRNLDGLTLANYEFHRIIVTAARSERLRLILSWVVDLPFMQDTFSRFEEAHYARSAAHHQEIISALRAHDKNWAVSVMRAHHAGARNAYLEIFDRAEQDSNASKTIIPFKAARRAS